MAGLSGAGFALDVQADISRVEQALNTLQREVLPRSTVQAINRTLKTVQSRVVDQIGEITNVPENRVRTQIAYHQATIQTMSGNLDARKGKALNLIEWVAKNRRNPRFFRRRIKRGKGAKAKGLYVWKGVQAKAWGKEKVYRGTFIGTSGGGEVRVYRRTSKARDKLTLVSGPSIRREFVREAIQASMKAIARNRFRIELFAALRNNLRRIGLSPKG